MVELTGKYWRLRDWCRKCGRVRFSQAISAIWQMTSVSIPKLSFWHRRLLFFRRKKWKQFYIPELLSYRTPNSKNHHIYKAAGRPIGYWLRRPRPRKGGTRSNSFHGHIVAAGKPIGYWLRRTGPRNWGTGGNSFHGHIVAAGKPIGYWLRRTRPRKGIVATVSKAAFQFTVRGFCCI